MGNRYTDPAAKEEMNATKNGGETLKEIFPKEKVVKTLEDTWGPASVGWATCCPRV